MALPPIPISSKALGAAMAATGAVALYHVKDVTPEAKKNRFNLSALEVISIESAEIDSLFTEIPVEAVAVGCPHCSPAELATIAQSLAGKNYHKTLLRFCCAGCYRKQSKDC